MYYVYISIYCIYAHIHISYPKQTYCKTRESLSVITQQGFPTFVDFSSFLGLSEAVARCASLVRVRWETGGEANMCTICWVWISYDVVLDVGKAVLLPHIYIYIYIYTYMSSLSLSSFNSDYHCCHYFQEIYCIWDMDVLNFDASIRHWGQGSQWEQQ